MVVRGASERNSAYRTGPPGRGPKPKAGRYLLSMRNLEWDVGPDGLGPQSQAGQEPTERPAVAMRPGNSQMSVRRATTGLRSRSAPGHARAIQPLPILPRAQ